MQCWGSSYPACLMRAAKAEFFVAYFAQGVQRIGKDYLRTLASETLGGDVSSLQLFYNLLPEFGSLPWTLKPVLMFLVERLVPVSRRHFVTLMATLATAGVWAYLALFAPSASVLLLCTAGASLGSAVVDGLVDGRVAEASDNGERAAECRYFCECGSVAGGLLVGCVAYGLALPQSALLGLTAAAWAGLGPLVLLQGGTHQSMDEYEDQARLGSPNQADGQLLTTGPARFSALLSRQTVIVSALSFAVCLTPALDFFLFRQHRLGLTASQQSLMAVLGSIGWFGGTAFYRHFVAKRFAVQEALRLCLGLWPVGGLLAVYVAAHATHGPMVMWWAGIEKLGHEFCKALTFMPCTVLMQLHAPAGCESTAFTLMQCSGTVGQVLSRNLEYWLMRRFGVDPTLGSPGFGGFMSLAVAVAVWRVATAFILCVTAVPFLQPVGLDHGAKQKRA